MFDYTNDFFIEYQKNIPLLDFTRNTRTSFSFKRYFKEDIEKGNMVIIKGSGFLVEYVEECHCDCPHCYHVDNYRKFFECEKAAKNFYKDIKSDGDYSEITISVDICFIKAVKQNKEIPGKLFKETTNAK